MSTTAGRTFARYILASPHVAAICTLLLLTLCCQTACLAASFDDFLPLGELRAAPQDEAAQAQLRDGLVKVVAAGEAQWAQGDIRFELVKSMTADSYRRLTAALPKPSGSRVSVVTLPKELLVGPITYCTRWTYGGLKVRHESRVVGDAEALVPFHYAAHADAVFDGERFLCYYPKDARGVMDSKQGSETLRAPEPGLILVRVDGDTLSGLLRSANLKYEGRQTVGDTECLKVTAAVGGLRYQIWISPTNGYCAKRIVFTRSETSVFAIAEVTSFQESGNGTWFPLSGRHAEFRPVEPGGGMVWLAGTEWTVTSYSPQAPDSAFALQFPEGTKVLFNSEVSLMSFVAGK